MLAWTEQVKYRGLSEQPNNPKLIEIRTFFRYTRSTVVGLACRYGIQQCKDEAISLFRQWMADENNNP